MRPASETERRRLSETFAALCRIESPFGRERACARYVAAELGALGIECSEDGAAAAASGAECGNLLARIAGASDRHLLLCAHLDTVALAAPVEPRLVDGGWINANDGILGADNKAAVAVLLEVARRAASEGSPVGIELLFTVSEENALAGAKQFDAASLRSEFGYVFDHATPIGGIVVCSPTYYRIEAEFRGVAVHAGIRPEQGRSAIVAAARAVAAMSLGRIDAQTTANVGSIAGGSPSLNVVPDRCRIECEVRSLDRDTVERLVAATVDAIGDGADAAECDVDTVVECLFQGYRAQPEDLDVEVARRALLACGHTPDLIETGGGSDANALRAADFRCTNLANGTERNHEPGERVSVAALEGMLDVAFALLDATAEDPGR